jgi:hypothetical protein
MKCYLHFKALLQQIQCVVKSKSKIGTFLTQIADVVWFGLVWFGCHDYSACGDVSGTKTSHGNRGIVVALGHSLSQLEHKRTRLCTLKDTLLDTSCYGCMWAPCSSFFLIGSRIFFSIFKCTVDRTVEYHLQLRSC